MQNNYTASGGASKPRCALCEAAGTPTPDFIRLVEAFIKATGIKIILCKEHHLDLSVYCPGEMVVGHCAREVAR